jgi:ATP-binding cassette subfamily C (CFTR/MRP) protein 4
LKIFFYFAIQLETTIFLSAPFIPIHHSPKNKKVSISRIQDFLSLEEQDAAMPGLHQNRRSKTEVIESEANVVEMINVDASWTSDYRCKTLSELNIRVAAGKLCAIIGHVGSGKSSIFQLLLGELPIYSGDVVISGDLSYASQDNWLFSGSVKHNILFGQQYNRTRYQEVIKHCALATDLQQLQHGDKTFVGERGCALSGGQRARVSLARAVYRNASIYLLDDPLSAVDAHVGQHIFNECIGPHGYLARQQATRILITHQVHFLKEADWIVVMDAGRVIRQGTWGDVMDIELEQYVAPESNDDDNLDGRTEAVENDDEEDDIPYIDDDVPEHASGYMKLRTTTDAKKPLSRFSSANSVAEQEESEERDEEKSATKIRFAKVFYEYFRAGASPLVLLAIVIYLLFSQAVTSGSDLFLTFWTNQELLRLHGEHTVLTQTTDGLYIYGFLILAVIFVTLSRGFVFFAVCMRASKKLHDRSFLCLLHSPMRFFDLNPTGRILNRFSKDMGAVDELLPKAIIEAVQV